MDIWGVFMFFILTFLIMSCCGYCCSSKRRGTVLSTPIAVTSVTHTGMSQSGVTQIPAHTYQPTVYAAPYPAQTTGNTTVQMPMPMPAAQPPMPGMQPYVTPYPPMPQPGVASMAPPSYDAAMANPTPSYEKQMPYNPNFAQ